MNANGLKAKVNFFKYKSCKKFLFLLHFFIISCADYDLLDVEIEPVQLSINDVTDSSVSLKWTQCKYSDFNNYKVYYSLNDVVDFTDSLSDSLTFRVDTTKTVFNLNSRTRYYFRIITTALNGEFSVSNIVDTITLKDTTFGSIKLFSPVQITDSSVVIRWTRCENPFDRYLIFMNTNRDVDNHDLLANTVYVDTTCRISNLNFNERYWFRVYAQKDTVFVAESNSLEVLIRE